MVLGGLIFSASVDGTIGVEEIKIRSCWRGLVVSAICNRVLSCTKRCNCNNQKYSYWCSNSKKSCSFNNPISCLVLHIIHDMYNMYYMCDTWDMGDMTILITSPVPQMCRMLGLYQEYLHCWVDLSWNLNMDSFHRLGKKAIIIIE